MLSKFYLALGIVIIALYGLISLSGRELGPSRRQYLPPDVRHAPGGYRSFHFWHTGYRGGK